MLWDLNENKHLYTLDHNHVIHSLCFSPNRYWLCVATGPSITIWDLEAKVIVDTLKAEVIAHSRSSGTTKKGVSKAEPPQCLSMAWSTDGNTLFAGYSDNTIRVWQVSVTSTHG